MLVRSHPQKGVLFLSPVKPANPPIPPSRAMWLRKRLRSRRVVGWALDWRKRVLALELSGGGWLMLSLESDPDIVDVLPPDFDRQPVWNSPQALLDDPEAPRSLRRAVEREDPQDRAAFLQAFLLGQARGFYLPEGEAQPAPPLPWPVGRSSVRYATALEAAAAYGAQAFFAALIPPEKDPAKEAARLRKRLALLDQDAVRLEGLCARRIQGEAIAANLSGLDSRAKMAPLRLDHPEHGPVDVPLDPALTVIENMERFFRQAAKGKRGLAHVERLRAEALEGRLAPPRDRAQPPARERSGRDRHPAKKRDIPLHRFRTSDGFVVLRGKNAAANHRLLSEVAAPYDYWFHAQGGPGAHVILRRDNPGSQVPLRSMEEAAALAGLAGWQGGAGQGRGDLGLGRGGAQGQGRAPGPGAPRLRQVASGGAGAGSGRASGRLKNTPDAAQDEEPHCRSRQRPALAAVSRGGGGVFVTKR